MRKARREHRSPRSLGYGITNDAHHVTAPAPHGAGFVRAIEQVLAIHRNCVEDVQYVTAHGTGTSITTTVSARHEGGVRRRATASR